MTDNDDNPASEVSLPRGAVGAVGEILKVAGKNPQGKEAGRELAQAALTVAKAVNVVLLPIAAINFGYERAKSYFHDRFQPDLEEKLADVPPEDLVEPKPSLAGPVMQGLAFSHDEHALREMYLHLLASAMNGKTSAAAHPAFVEIIKQLTAEEAQLLCSVLGPPQPKEIVQVRLARGLMGGWVILLSHLLSFGDLIMGKPLENLRLPAMIDNWARLGLIEVSYRETIHNAPGQNGKRYAWVEERPEFKRLKASNEEARQKANTPEQKALLSGNVVAHPGILRTTDFGVQFFTAVGMNKILTGLIAEARARAAPSALDSNGDTRRP